jgi:hypothetical protein
VYVLYNVNGFPKSGIFDIGNVYVVAIESETTHIEHFDITHYDRGYRYRIHPMAAGSYRIGASTDHDGDFIIFEPEDSIGFYISIDQIVMLDFAAGQNLTDINFDLVNSVAPAASPGPW